MKAVLILFVIALVIAERPPLPQPTEGQIEWLESGIIGFLHYGVNTYTDREWGLGNEDPKVFAPTNLNASDWIDAYKPLHTQEIILVAKHHDGFFMYPNPYTNHSVASSDWKNGKGDVLREFVNACRKEHMKPAFYLSPWDRNQYNMTWDPKYNAFYAKTLEYLLQNYSPVYEMWWDGANAQEGMTDLYIINIYNIYIIYKYNEKCMGTITGPDADWGGTESGLGKEEYWLNKKPKTLFPRPGEEYVFMPSILDVSIRGGWFWHLQEEPRYLKDLVNIYWKSIAYGYTLQLNVPPTKEGLIDERDKTRLREFGQYIDALNGVDYALLSTHFDASSAAAEHPASSLVNGDKMYYWKPAVETFESAEYASIYFDEPATFDVVLAEEYIRHGQTVAKFHFDALIDGQWKTVASGTTIGLKKMVKISSPVTATGVRLTIDSTWNNYVPEISRIGLLVEPSY
ncbi:hypothetical protein WA158_004085 [Blastocystis sp. Blastoise]